MDKIGWKINEITGICIINPRGVLGYYNIMTAQEVYDMLNGSYNNLNISYYNSGAIKSIILESNGSTKLSYGPLEEYYFNEEGFEDSLDGKPSHIKRLVYTKYRYCKSGKLHNETYPAMYDLDNKANVILNTRWFLNGKEYFESWQINNWVDFCKDMKQLEVYE